MSVDEAMRRLRHAGLLSPERTWRGVPESELVALEATRGERLPDDYRRFMSLVGISGAEAIEDGSAILWPGPQYFDELILDMKPPPPMQPGSVPLLVHQGYYVQWIDRPSGHVLAWTEGVDAESPDWISSSFTDWLVLAIPTQMQTPFN